MPENFSKHLGQGSQTQIAMGPNEDL